MLCLTKKFSLYKLIFLVCAASTFLYSAFINQTYLKRAGTDNYRTIYQNPALKALKSEIKTEPFRVATVGLTKASSFSGSDKNFFPAYAATYGLETVDGYFSLYSGRYQKFWGQVIAPLTRVDSGVHQLWTKSPKHIYLYAPLDDRFQRIGFIKFTDYYDLDLLSLANTKYLISRWPLDDPNLKLIYKPTHEFTKHSEWRRQSRFSRIKGLLNGDVPHYALYVYENRSVFPRAFIAPNLKTFDTPDALLTSLSHATSASLRTSAYVNSADASFPIPVAGELLDDEVVILDYTPDQITISIRTSTHGTLVITNNFNPYWKCTVDGTPRNIIPVYHTFQGVPVTPGDHEITLSYQPPYALH
jgi:hypothetical protein